MMKIDFSGLEPLASLCVIKEHDEISKPLSFELPITGDVSSDLIVSVWLVLCRIVMLIFWGYFSLMGFREKPSKW